MVAKVRAEQDVQMSLSPKALAVIRDDFTKVAGSADGTVLPNQMSSLLASQLGRQPNASEVDGIVSIFSGRALDLTTWTKWLVGPKMGESDANAQSGPDHVVVARMAAVLGWELSHDQIEFKNMSGRGAATTYRVDAPGQVPVALHVCDSADEAASTRRLGALVALFGEHGLTSRRLHHEGNWYVEEWGGTTLVAPFDDGYASVTGPAAWDAAELGVLLAKVHQIPTDWFEPFRSEYCDRLPALREAGPTNLVWFWHGCFSFQPTKADSKRFGVPLDQLADCRANIDNLHQLLTCTLGLSDERLAEWVQCGEGRMHWRSSASAQVVTVHNDFWHHNILRHADQGLKVIDLEFACVLPAAADVCYALLHFEGVSADIQAFVRAYLTELGEDASDVAIEDFIVDGVCWWWAVLCYKRDLVAPSGAPMTDAWLEAARNLSAKKRQEIIEKCGTWLASTVEDLVG